MAEDTTTTDAPNAADGPPAGDPALRERVARLEQQNDEFLRHLAEFQNRNNEMLQVMRRKDQELEGRLKFAHEKFALDLLTALDNLERAVEAAKTAGETGPLTTGVAATQAQILDVLKRHGITPILQPIRYDTYFYLAALPAGQVAGDLSTETERAAWTAPAAAVAAYGDGVLATMPPTLSILLELSALSTVAEALAAGADRVIETVLPEVVRGGDGWVFRYPPSRTSATG